MELYLIRHGQSEANLHGIIQGHADYPLSGLGKKQAAILGEYSASLKADNIYSSDLVRAKETAEAIADQRSLEVKTWPEIREVGLGPFEGRTRIDIMEKYPNLKHESLLTSGVEGTETVENITQRCREVIRLLKEKHQNETTVLVSHGGFISILLTFLMAGDEWPKMDRPFIIGNTSITKVEIDDTGKAKFHYINKTAHLEEKEESLTSTVLY
ncbi:histidine phosphatase family protein [Evansella clarkii]|uniref:histidine phosphatase family protein n=1 Tax=Evansella clarkii TaxID=79879 RepID=UPI000B42D36F|nr:histidine phosphatase family protein [Evansella clarkii]